MSVRVDLAALGAQIGHYGDVAFLVTTAGNAAGSPAAPTHPHVVSVRLGFADGVLTMAAGRSSRANVAGSPDVTLCWPGEPGGEYCLLVDGRAVADDAAGTVTVSPTGAILHRLAGAPSDLPYCAPVGE